MSGYSPAANFYVVATLSVTESGRRDLVAERGRQRTRHQRDREPRRAIEMNPRPPEPHSARGDHKKRHQHFAEYFSDKFLELKGKAEVSLLEALKVGALIEELDMKDINYCNGIIYEVFQFPISTPCGLTDTDVRPLENTLGNLLAGSENHLCAFTSQIGPISDGCYEAQHLTQGEVWDIIDAQCCEFLEHVCMP